MSSTGGGSSAPAKKKRVRKQKTEVDLEAAAAARQHQAEEDDAAEVAEEAAPAKKVKREEKAAPATKQRAPPQQQQDAQMEDGGEGESKAEDTTKDAAAAGAGYLSQETLNYYKQLAAVLDKDDFENDEDKQMFLANVVEELCGAEAGKVRATTRRGVAGEAEDRMDESDASAVQNTSNPAFVLQRLCSHAKCSHLVQKIMEIASPEQVGMFLTALQDNVLEVLADRYGSHVLEAVLFRLPQLLMKEAEEAESTGKDDLLRIQQSTASKTKQAWRNLGTHSAGSVMNSGPDKKKTPLRAHLFGLVCRVIPDGNWLELAKDAHAAFAMRHIVNLLAGETNLKALADAAAGVKTPASTAAAAASSSSSSSPSSLASHLFPPHLSGLSDLLPWLVQEISGTEKDELEEATRNASAAPFLQTVLRATERTSKALGEHVNLNNDDDDDSLTSSASDRPVLTHLTSLLASLLSFSSTSDASQWPSEHVTQAQRNQVWLFLCDRSGSRLFETICSVAPAKLIGGLFQAHWTGRVKEIAMHQIGNFALQHLLQAVRKEWRSSGRHLVRQVYDELSPHFTELASSSRTGVLLQLLDAAMRIGVKEQKIFKHLAQMAMDSFDSTTATPITQNPVGALLLTPALKGALADKESVGVIGAMMVQSCLQPGRGLQNLPVSDDSAGLASSQPFSTALHSFLALPPEFMLKLATDTAGSHVFDAFTRAPCSLSVKQQLLRRFQMRWVELCLNPAGSFVLERLFELAPNQLKVGIAGDLVRAEKRVLASRWGSLVYRKLRLEHFKRHQPSWLTSSTEKKGRAQAMFQDVIGETPAASSAASKTEGKPAKKDEAKSSKKDKPIRKPKPTVKSEADVMED